MAREVESLFSVRGGCKQSKIDGSLLCVQKKKSHERALMYCTIK
jgi:hypothetical protein